MGEKRTIEGELYHELEELGNQTYEHLGFRDKDNKFGDMLAEIVPEIGMRKKVRLTMEVLDIVRVAFATDDGENLTEEHFGSAKKYLIYEYNLDENKIQFVEERKNTSPEEKEHGDPEKAKGVASILGDVDVLVNLAFGLNIQRMKKRFVIVVSRLKKIRDVLERFNELKEKISENLKKEEKEILYLE